MSLRLEQEKVKGVRDDSLIERLVKSQIEYEKQKDIIESAISGHPDGKVTSPDEIAKLEKQLFALKHFGKTLEQIKFSITTDSNCNSTHPRTIIAEKPKKRPGNSGSRLGHWITSTYKRTKHNVRSAFRI